MEGILTSGGWYFHLQKGGSEVEVKKSLPPSEILIYRGVFDNLVEVEVKSIKKFSKYYADGTHHSLHLTLASIKLELIRIINPHLGSYLLHSLTLSYCIYSIYVW